MSDDLSIAAAYRAMLQFLEDYYDRTGSDEIGGLLGGLQLDDDGHPMDPAVWADWLSAVGSARGGEITE